MASGRFPIFGGTAAKAPTDEAAAFQIG